MLKTAARVAEAAGTRPSSSMAISMMRKRTVSAAVATKEGQVRATTETARERLIVSRRVTKLMQTGEEATSKGQR